MSERKASMGDKIYRGDVVKFIRNNISLDTFMKRTVKTADEACWDLCDKLNYVPAIKENHEPHWIPVMEDTPDEERECWITPKTTSKVYRGVFTRHYGECHRTGFICDDGFMWLNTALAWMYYEVPEPYKGVTEWLD